MFRLRALCPLLLLLSFAGPAPAEEQSLELELISWNVWGLPFGLSADRERRLERVGEELARLRPQLVALQEVWAAEDGERLQQILARAGLEHAWHQTGGIMGSGLLVASTYPIEGVAFRQFALGGKPEKPWHGDWYTRKGLLEVRLQTPLGPVVLYDTHLHASYGSDEYLPIQITQALETARWMGAHGQRPPAAGSSFPPAILAGDINGRRGTPAFELLCTRAGLAVPPAPLRIDWVLTRPGTQLDLELLEIRPALTEPVPFANGESQRLSDHPAMVTRLRLTQRAPASPDPLAARQAWEQAAQRAVPRVRAELAARLERSRWLLGSGAGLLALGALLLALGRRRRGARGSGCLLALAVPLLLSGLACLALGGLHEREQVRAYEAALAELQGL